MPDYSAFNAAAARSGSGGLKRSLSKRSPDVALTPPLFTRSRLHTAPSQVTQVDASCRGIERLPSVFFRVLGHDFEVSPSEYVMRLEHDGRIASHLGRKPLQLVEEWARMVHEPTRRDLHRR